MYSRQKLVLLLIGTMCLLQKTTAQNPIFRQLYTHRYLTNPALVGNGSQEGISINRIASGTKAQWLSLDSRLVTQTLSFDAPVNANNSSWGIGAFLTDLHSGGGENSKYSHFSGTLTYAYNIPLKKMNLKFGLSAQYSAISFGADQFDWEDQINENMTGFVKPTAEIQSRLTKNVVHASIGALAFNKKGFFGVALHNVNEPSISFFENKSQKIERKFLVHGGIVLNKLFKNAVVTPNFSYALQGDVASQNFSTNVKLSNIQFAFGAQHIRAYGNEAWAINNYFGFRYDKYFIGYSNDWNLNFNFGSIPVTHEVSIMILLNRKEKKESVNPFPEI